MLDSKALEDIAKKLHDSLPEGVKNVQKDIEKNFHTVLKSAFAKLDLVTREEFDHQNKVLAKTRQKLNQIEKQLKAMESGDKPTAPKKK